MATDNKGTAGDYASAPIRGTAVEMPNIEEFGAGITLDALRKGYMSFYNKYGRQPTLAIIGHDGYTLIIRAFRHFVPTPGQQPNKWLEDMLGVRILFDPEKTSTTVEWLATVPDLAMETSLFPLEDISTSKTTWRQDDL